MKSKKILLIGGLLSIFLIGLYFPSSFLGKDSFLSPEKVLADDSDISSQLTLNKESKKIYYFNYFNFVEDPNGNECHQKYYHIFFGPFDYPVTLSFSVAVQGNLSVNGEVIDSPTRPPTGGDCYVAHTVDSKIKIPKGTKIDIALIGTGYMGDSLAGTLTITNTVFKDDMDALQKAAKNDNFETLHLIATYADGMTKDYVNNPSESTGTSVAYASVLASISEDVNKYGRVVSATSIHDHPPGGVVGVISTKTSNELYACRGSTITLDCGYIRRCYKRWG